MAGVAYDSSDPLQRSFLGALAHGESGGFSAPYSVGYGGADLSTSPTDANGFPIWSGAGSTHAAGAYQFQPGTWAGIASTYGLNFQNPGDQDAGAWYQAQQADPTLEADLQAGNYSKIQGLLSKIWPSVTGSANNPQGLGGSIAAGVGLPTDAGAAQSPADAAASANPFSVVENWFLRGGLILVGGLVVVIGLYFLLANNGMVPTPKQIASAI